MYLKKLNFYLNCKVHDPWVGSSGYMAWPIWPNSEMFGYIFCIITVKDRGGGYIWPYIEHISLGYCYVSTLTI